MKTKRAEKTMGHCNLCMRYHCYPSQEWSCMGSGHKYPKYKKMPTPTKNKVGK